MRRSRARRDGSLARRRREKQRCPVCLFLTILDRSLSDWNEKAAANALACPCLVHSVPSNLRSLNIRQSSFASLRLGAFALSAPAAAVQVETISTQSRRDARTQRESHFPNGTHPHTLRKVAASSPMSEDERGLVFPSSLNHQEHEWALVDEDGRGGEEFRPRKTFDYEYEHRYR